MQFIKSLRDRVKTGEITTSIRVWQSPRVKAGGQYRLDEGFVVVDSIRQISLGDITPEMARLSGFAGVVDLLKTAKHGAGEKVFLIRFHYVEADRSPNPAP